MKKSPGFAPAVSKGKYDSQKAWGLLASINLYQCDPKLINSPKAIKKFVVNLCRLIDMKRYGSPLIERFAEGPLEGYSMMQFIETSSITAHFDEQDNRAFVDIFSCQYFSAEKAKKYCHLFFKAKKSKMKVLIRN